MVELAALSALTAGSPKLGARCLSIPLQTDHGVKQSIARA